MKFNRRVDLDTLPKVDASYFNKRLEHLREDVYVTFVATKSQDEDDAWKDEIGSHLYIVLPYDRVVDSDNNVELMKEYLLNRLASLNWLDYQSLEREILHSLSAAA